jgi:pyruvate/2-oxoglutarate dehydrogenase complex dihydrolipoamide dehydrogenase (E3) component
MSEREFDVVVLGAGPAGEVCAGRLGESGATVAIVEPHLVGGECSFYACMPSKALLRPGELLAEVRRIPGVADAVGGLDVKAVLERRDEIIHNLDDKHMEPWLADRGVELVRGAGRFEGERRVAVGDDTLVAKRAVVVATGTGPSMPPIDGLEQAKPWTNREATTAKQAPERLAILGGGVVGVELAQAWRSLGSQVTLIEAADRVLAREEPFASEDVERSLTEQGVEIRKGAQATAVRSDDGEVVVELEAGGSVPADELLIAVGRRPNTTDLGVESIGLEPGKSIEVDDHMRRPDMDWLYAIGDVNGRALLTHMGKYQARIAADVILGVGGPCLILDGERAPRVTFTDPQVAAVGYTLDAARQAGLNVRAVDVPTQASAGASFYGRDDAPGTSRLVVDEDAGLVVGATFTGPEVAEWLQAATIAVVGKVPLELLAHAVPAFPTRSEVWLYLMQELGLSGPCQRET